MTQGKKASRVLTCTALVLLVIALCIVWGNMGKPHNNGQPSRPTAASLARSAVSLSGTKPETPAVTSTPASLV